MGSRTTAFALALFLIAPPALAAPKYDEKDRETARAHMDEGKAFTKSGELERALEAYQKAHDLMHVPTTGMAVARTGPEAVESAKAEPDSVAKPTETPKAGTGAEPPAPRAKLPSNSDLGTAAPKAAEAPKTPKPEGAPTGGTGAKFGSPAGKAQFKSPGAGAGALPRAARPLGSGTKVGGALGSAAKAADGSRSAHSPAKKTCPRETTSATPGWAASAAKSKPSGKTTPLE